MMLPRIVSEIHADTKAAKEAAKAHLNCFLLSLFFGLGVVRGVHEDEVQAEHHGNESAAGGDDSREVVEIKRADDLDFGYCSDVSFMVKSHPVRHRSLRRSLFRSGRSKAAGDSRREWREKTYCPSPRASNYTLDSAWRRLRHQMLSIVCFVGAHRGQ